MKESTATGMIRFIKTPDGEAPSWVREAWLKVESMPCEPILGLLPFDSELNALSRTQANETGKSRKGVNVPQALALEVLEKVSPEAANWWREHGFPHDEEFFVFAEDEFEIISGVRHQVVRMVDEMDHPRYALYGAP